jgi:hypothetical protein
MMHRQLLVGHILFHVQLASNPPERNVHKRKRSIESPPLTSDEPKAVGDRPSFIGWLFVADSPSRTCYLLSVPENLQALVYDAYRTRRAVCFDEYAIIPIEPSIRIFLDTVDNSTNLAAIALLEIQRAGGIQPTVECCSTANGTLDSAETAGKDWSEEDVWTLEQLARLEAVNHQEQHAQGNTRRIKNPTFSFRALVVAVSPILVVPPGPGTTTASDPFALIQIVQHDTSGSNYEAFYAVILARKKCLVRQTCLAPGVSIVIRGASKKRWSIPNTVSSSTCLVPQSVFVVDRSPEQIQLDPDLNGDQIQKGLSMLQQILPYPLSVVDGVITNIHYMILPDKSRIPHFVEVTTLQGRECALFLTYFPMSVALQLSLRVGASMRAVQVYDLGLSGFAAVLRSHVTVLAANTSNPSTALDVAKHRPPLSLFPSFSLTKVRFSYRHLWCRRMIGRAIQTLEAFYDVVPSLDDLMNALLEIEKPKSLSRNVYAEFFDDANDITVKDTMPSSGFTSFCSRREGLEEGLPQCISMESLQNRCFDLIENRLDIYTRQHPTSLHAGWTASIQFAGPQSLWENFSGDANRGRGSNHRLFSIGKATIVKRHGMSFASLSDGQRLIPVLVTCDFGIAEGEEPSFFWVRLQCVVVTCVCISTSQLHDGNVAGCEKTFLPPFAKSGVWTEPIGPCAIVKANGFIFLVSCFLVSDCLRSTGKSSNSGDSAYADKPSFQTVEDCLSAQALDAHSSSMPHNEQTSLVLGLLVRSRLRKANTKGDQYKNYSITIAQSPSVSFSRHDISCLQSIDFRPPLTLEATMNHVLLDSIGHSLLEGELVLGMAWWSIACDISTCALHGGGWDEAVRSTDASGLSIGVLVGVPSGAVDPQRGYTRIRCRVQDLVATVTCQARCPANATTSPHENDATLLFDCIGGTKFVAGMLDRRPRRLKFANYPHSEHVEHPVNAGIPSRRLADLFASLCRDLRLSSRSELTPSLVYEIRGCSLLGVSYCRALAECSQCYSPLQAVSGSQAKPETSGVAWSGSAESYIEQPSFWHVPVYDQCATYSSSTETLRKTSSNHSLEERRRDNRNKSLLRCINNCRVDLYGAIKWECSATIDDGTGQAKLYAEREAALCLLGLPASTIAAVEDGAWENPEGIVFSKAKPPKPHMRPAILTARSLALNRIRMLTGDGNRASWSRQPALADDDVLGFLTPTTRAEYLLHRHCQISKRPLRPLTYFVRCKPLSDGIVHLNLTTIEVAGPYSGRKSSHDVATYSLPPLKLNLVDCCCCDCVNSCTGQENSIGDSNGCNVLSSRQRNRDH